MGISVKDERLLEGSKKARRKLQGLEYGGRSQELTRIADELLEESVADFERKIKRAERKEELEELISGQDLLANPKSRLGETAARIYYMLQARYSTRRAKGEPVSDRDKEIETFLRNLDPSEFINTSFPNAIESLERATELANQFIPDEVRNISNQARDQIQSARNQFEEMSQQAIDAYADLQEARKKARHHYLAAREVASAALRLKQQTDKLNDLVPPISRVLNP